MSLNQNLAIFIGLLAICVALLFTGSPVPPKPTPPPARLSLAAPLDEAYEVLLTTEHIPICDFIYEGGVFPPQIPAFQTGLASDQANIIFKDLTMQPNPHAQMLGLCGLYYTDPADFLTQGIRIFKANPEVSTIGGCLVFSTCAQVMIGPIGQVKLDAQGQLILEPKPGTKTAGKDLQIATGQLPEFLRNTKQSDRK